MGQVTRTLIAPQPGQFVGKASRDPALSGIGCPAYRRPCRNIAKKGRKAPFAFDVQRRGGDLGKGEIHPRIAAVDQLAFGRPEAVDLVMIKALEPLVQRRIVKTGNAVADQREDRPRRRKTPCLGIEGEPVEPMRGLRGGDQIGAVIGQGDVLGRRAKIADARMRPGIRDLLGAGVKADHLAEMIGKQPGQLPGAAADIQRRGPGVRQAGKTSRQRGGYSGRNRA